MMLRLRQRCYSPDAYLFLAILGLCGMYLVSACALDFMSIRYLVPLWVALPGLLASLAVSRTGGFHWLACLLKPTCLVGMLVACSLGQIGLVAQLGAAHPLEELARQLRQRGIDSLCAETLDAHLLTYFTQQQVQIAEFQPFWSRLSHLPGPRGEGARRYLVRRPSYQGRWTWPGPLPVQAQETLAPTLRAWIGQHPGALLSRVVISEDYEIWTLAAPIPHDYTPTTTALAVKSR
jgi:hypothetical protein